MTPCSQYRIAFGVVLVAAFVSAAGLLLRAEPPQAVGTWASIGATPESRIGGAAVALADGRTLIAGGSIQGTPIDTVVIFNPTDGSFASAGQLLAPRVGHTATLLDDGRVLIVGGTVAGLLRNDLELFDPSSGTSEPSATMPRPRSGHAAARLADGTVLIAGGTTTDDVVLQTAEIYDPSADTTTPTTLPMLMPRTGASATTLIDGRVLIAGGNNGSADLASAEIYQPWSQLFEAVDTGMSMPRSGHAAVLLPWNNSVLIAGGSSNYVAQLTSDLFLPAEFPDPYSYGIGHFGPTGSMAAPRVSAVAAPHIEGYAVAMGGGAADAEVYRFATVKTDKDDYAPGVKAIISGSGWEYSPDPDKGWVTLVFQEDPAVHEDYVLHVKADSNGNIYWDQWAPEEHDLNVRFYLMVKQATPQGERRAQTTFTDARNFTLTFSGAGTGSVTLDTTTGIHSGTFKVPVACGGTNSNITSWTFTSTCTSISLNENDATGTLTANANAGSAFAGWGSPSNFTGCTLTSPCSFSVTSSSPAITATFNAGSVATTTAVASSLNPSTHGNSVTFTATVSSTSTPAGGVSFVIDGGSSVAGTPGAATATTATWTYTTSALNAGTHTVSASYVHSGSFQDSSGSLSGGQVVNKATPTATLAVNNSPQTYTGSGLAATVTISTSSVPGAVANILTGGAATQMTVGTYAVTANFVPTDTTNYNTLTGLSAENFVIAKAASTTTTVGDGPFTYDGTTHTGGSGTVTGAGGLTTSATSVTYTGDQVNAGTYSVTAHYAGDANHFGSDGAAVGIDITKASSATTTVGAGPFVYDTTTHSGGSGTVTGIGGLSTSATSLTYTGDQVNAGTYYVTAHYAGDANHLGSDGAAVGIEITKAASATTTVGAGPFVYDTTTHSGGSGTVTGAGIITGSATVTYSGDQINAGTYYVTAHYAGDVNHFGSDGDPVGIDISKAASTTTTVGDGPFVYTGSTQTGGSGTVTGAGIITGSATVTYSGDQINAGTYYVTAHYAGDVNHFGSDGDPVGIDISKAASTTTTVGDGPFVYTGSTQTGGSGTVTGIGGLSTSATSLTYTGDQVNAGTYSVTAHYAGDANHFGSDGDPVGIDISKAASTTTTVGAGPFVYTGSTQTGGSGTVSGAGVITGSATVTYTGDQVNVGTYSVTAHYAGDANHFGSDGDPVGIDISKAASATTTVGDGPFVYTGSTQTGGSGTVSGAGVITGSATVTYTGDQINVGTYSVTAHYAGDANHFGSDGDPVGIDISKAASATTTVGDGPFVYTGSTQTGGSGTVSGAGVITGSATVTYTGDQVNVGTYSVTAHYAGDANHFGSDGDPVGIDISKAASTTTTVGAGPFVYDTTTHSGGSGTVTGIGGLSTSATSLTYTGDQVNAGTYYVTARYAGDANHFGSDGAAVGIEIIKASSATTTVGAGPFVYTGSTQTGGSGTVSGAGVITGSATVTYSGNQINVGTYYVTAHYAGDANHNPSDGAAVGIEITKANAVVVVAPYNVQWDGNEHTATHTIAGVNGETGATVGTVNVSNTAHTIVGTYAGDSWSFTGGANYNNIASRTITDVISTGYCFNGFLPPIGGSFETSNGGSFLDPVRAFKLGSTIPVKFLLNSRNGSSCGAVVTTGIHTLQAIYYSNSVDSDPAIDASPTDAATAGSQFRLTNPEWHFNLSTKGVGFKAGTWLLKATLQDGSLHSVWITIKK